jgi:DHA1 family inner membrane transport protein
MAIGAGFSPAVTGYVGAATALGGLLLWGVAVLVERQSRTNEAVACQR